MGVCVRVGVPARVHVGKFGRAYGFVFAREFFNEPLASGCLNTTAFLCESERVEFFFAYVCICLHAFYRVLPCQ